MSSSDTGAFLSSRRASRELDRHKGDPIGGYGFPPEIPGSHDGRAAQRRGTICSSCQEDSYHGERHKLAHF